MSQIFEIIFLKTKCQVTFLRYTVKISITFTKEYTKQYQVISMSPYRFRKKVQQYGYTFLSIIILLPKILLLLNGQITIGEFYHYKSNKASINSMGYKTSIVKYSVDSESYLIETSDLFFDENDKNIRIIYDKTDPNNASIRSFTGLFLIRIILSIAACAVWWGITDLFLKFH
jgi:hypothetical protein